MSFDGKVVIVTGASSGIGAATAKLFAKEGAKVVIVARTAEKLEKVAAECGAGKALIVAGDVSDDAVQKKVVDETITKFGRIDTLVNNAATSIISPVFTGAAQAEALLPVDIDASNSPKFGVEAYDGQFGLNVRAAVGLCALVVPHLVKTKGSIVNISSGAGKRCYNGCILYSMSKAALDMMTYGLCQELGPVGVRVNTVSPGATLTGFADKYTGGESEKVFIEFAKKYHPMGIPCKPEDIANSVVFLADEKKAAMITGTVLHVDGGAVQFAG